MLTKKTWCRDFFHESSDRLAVIIGMMLFFILNLFLFDPVKVLEEGPGGVTISFIPT